MTGGAVGDGTGGCDCGCAGRLLDLQRQVDALCADVVRLASAVDASALCRSHDASDLPARHDEPAAAGGRDQQRERAVRERLALFRSLFVGHELGVLEAPPGSGKTVMGCALIAHHRVPTLVLVDRAPLLAQWRERITAVLDIDPAQVGQIGGGKTRPTGIIDLAMLQTVSRMDDAGTRLSGYGLVIVDEVHHAGAPTVEKAVRRIPARRWVGLTATAYRRDGLGPVIFMHCGPKRYVIPLVDAADPAPLQRCLHAHTTSFALPEGTDTAKPGAITSTVFGGLVADDARNDQVCGDVHDALTRGRNCLVLTRRTAHVETLAARLRALGHDPKLLYATRKAAELKQVLAFLAFLADPPPGSQPLLVVAVDKYVGEGYDGPARTPSSASPALRQRRLPPSSSWCERTRRDSCGPLRSLLDRRAPYRPLRRSSARKLRLRRLVSFSAVT